MSSIGDNFSCFDSDLSQDNITEDAWTLQSEGRFHEKTITAIAVIQLLIILIGLLWNFIVATVIISKKLFGEPSYILLLSLVISDLLVCVLSLPFNVASGLKQTFVIGTSDYSRCQACQATIIITICLIFVSLFSLALMSADRLFYIKNSFIYSRYITPMRALVAIVITWMFCFFISIPPVFGFGDIKFSNSVGSCSVVGRTRLTANIGYVIFLSLIATIPFILTVVSNVWLLVISCKSTKNIHRDILDNNNVRLADTLKRLTSEQQINAVYHRKQIYLAKVFGTLFGVNAFLWLATVFVVIVAFAVNPENVPHQVFALVFLAFVCQPAIHPMLETCLIGKAKTTLLKHLLFGSRSLQKKQNVQQKIVNKQPDIS